MGGTADTSMIVYVWFHDTAADDIARSTGAPFFGFVSMVPPWNMWDPFCRRTTTDLDAVLEAQMQAWRWLSHWGHPSHGTCTRSRDQCSSDLPLSASGNDFRSIDPVRIRKAAARCETCTMDVGLLTTCQVAHVWNGPRHQTGSVYFGIIKNLEFHFLTGSLLQPRIASLLCWCREWPSRIPGRSWFPVAETWFFPPLGLAGQHDVYCNLSSPMDHDSNSWFTVDSRLFVARLPGKYIYIYYNIYIYIYTCMSFL